MRSMSQAALLPRTFQANVARLYLRVIGPGLDALPVHPQVQTGVAPDRETFLDRAAGQVDNYTANEACKVFALVLVSLFERQLRLWAPHILDGQIIKENPNFRDVLHVLARQVPLDLATDGLQDTIIEAFEVGNVVRHGPGRALTWLQTHSPHLIDRSRHDYVDISMAVSPDSEWLRIRQQDVLRYAATMTRFWGLADHDLGAVADLSVIRTWLTQPMPEAAQ
jgi:hypothetical protein